MPSSPDHSGYGQEKGDGTTDDSTADDDRSLFFTGPRRLEPQALGGRGRPWWNKARLALHRFP
jgi:hypothetical protein